MYINFKDPAMKSFPSFWKAFFVFSSLHLCCVSRNWSILKEETLEKANILVSIESCDSIGSSFCIKVVQIQNQNSKLMHDSHMETPPKGSYPLGKR